MKPKSKILIIAGSDSSGGAGIQADIKTVTSLGSYAMTAITAITSQNTKGIKNIITIDPKMISDQIEYSSSDIKPDAIKIGMLHSKRVIINVLNSLKKINIKKIILDPVMVSTSGVKLINKNCIELIKSKLLKKASLITPNIPEAEEISKIKISNLNDMKKAAKKIEKMGAKNILIKGGHLKSKYVFDLLYSKKKFFVIKNLKIKTKNTHGTGCTLSSAIAVHYSCGKSLKRSCELSIRYVNDALKTAPKYGRGNGPINHLNNLKLN